MNIHNLKRKATKIIEHVLSRIQEDDNLHYSDIEFDILKLVDMRIDFQNNAEMQVVNTINSMCRSIYSSNEIKDVLLDLENLLNMCVPY